MKIRCFKRFMANMNLVKGTTLTVEKKPLVPVLLDLQSRFAKKFFWCC